MGNAIVKYVQRFFGLNEENISADSNQVPPPKTYSWDKRPRETKMLTAYQRLLSIGKQSDQIVHRGTEEIKGNGPLVLKNCTRCLITVLDYCDSVIVDDCEDCVFLLGPVRGSIFLRNCNNCVVVVHCQQFRSRDCCAIKSFLFCATQPSIETSTDMMFKGLLLRYPALEEHLKLAGLSECNNRWDQVHDFTPAGTGKNWSILPADASPEAHMKDEQLAHCKTLGIQFHGDNEQSISLQSSGTDDISTKFLNLVGP